MRHAKEALSLFGPSWQGRSIELKPIAAGYSGGEVFRVRSPWQEVALRRWPTTMPPERILAIHSLQNQARQAGLLVVPELHRTPAGQSLVPSSGGWWELSDWRRGTPAVEPRSVHFDGLIGTLRHWYDSHRQPSMIETLGPTFGVEPVQAFLDRSPKPSPGIERRWRVWREADLDHVPVPISDTERELIDRTRRVRDAQDKVFGQLEQLLAWRFTWEVCLRDVHREHVLFEDERVSGLIDFGSVGFDTPAVDLARYLSSFARFSPTWLDGDGVPGSSLREVGLDKEAWHQLVLVLVVTGTMAGCLQWKQWIVDEHRSFPDRSAALERWNDRLEFLETLPAGDGRFA